MHQDEALEHLTIDIEGQLHFRREKAVEYPDDRRNAEAVSLLETMLPTIADVPGDLLLRWHQVFLDEDRAHQAQETWRERLRWIGFHSAPETATDLLTDFLDEVAAPGNSSLMH